MALYDVPVHTGYRVLTHSAHPLFQKNGLKQVGNTTMPAHAISAKRVAPSAIYNPKLSGISEAGYGQRYPYHGLSYPGAGSPRASVGLRYAGAGSPKTSVLRGLAYSGAGSHRASIYRPGLGYAGAGSPRSSVLRDAYINDNPPPNTLKALPPAKMLNRGVSGLADDPTVSPDTDFGTPLPSTNVWNDLTAAVSSIFSSAVQAGTQAGSLAVDKAIQGGGASPVMVSPIATTIKKAATNTINIMGVAVPTTALLLGGGILAYVYLRK